MNNITKYIMTYPSEPIKLITELCFLETPRNELKRADLVLVFGSEFIEGSVDAIEMLYSKGLIDLSSKVIFSGATGSLNVGKESEAQRMYAEAIKRALPKSIFIVEDRATNCKENILFSKDVIGSLGGFDRFHNILFVCMAFMARRAQMSAAQQGYPIDRIQFYGLVNPYSRNISKDSWWEREESCSRVLAEVQRIAQYIDKGDLTLYVNDYNGGNAK